MYAVLPNDRSARAPIAIYTSIDLLLADVRKVFPQAYYEYATSGGEYHGILVLDECPSDNRMSFWQTFVVYKTMVNTVPDVTHWRPTVRDDAPRYVGFA